MKKHISLLITLTIATSAFGLNPTEQVSEKMENKTDRVNQSDHIENVLTPEEQAEYKAQQKKQAKEEIKQLGEKKQEDMQLTPVVKPSQGLLKEIEATPKKKVARLCEILIGFWTNKEINKEEVEKIVSQTVYLSDDAKQIAFFMPIHKRPYFIAHLSPDCGEILTQLDIIKREYKHEDENGSSYKMYSFAPTKWNPTETIKQFLNLSPIEQKSILSSWISEEVLFGQPIDHKIDEPFLFDDFPIPFLTW